MCCTLVVGKGGMQLMLGNYKRGNLLREAVWVLSLFGQSIINALLTYPCFCDKLSFPPSLHPLSISPCHRCCSHNCIYFYFFFSCDCSIWGGIKFLESAHLFPFLWAISMCVFVSANLHNSWGPDASSCASLQYFTTAHSKGPGMGAHLMWGIRRMLFSVPLATCSCFS